MKHFLLILCLLFANICYADTYTRIEEISPKGKYLTTPEFFIEVWEWDTDKSSCWVQSDRIIVTERGYLINIDRDKTVRMVDLKIW